MHNYLFHNLSDLDFEYLSRDLLQKYLNTHLESYGKGPDGGLDLKGTYKDNKAIIVVQCKHYLNTTFATFLKKLYEEELPKVASIKPKRYIIVTSQSITDMKKKEIVEKFSPYIHCTSDIFTKEDINNLLSQYPEVEKNHYKLWITSTPILQKILLNQYSNSKDFEEENIAELAKYYVPNKNYNNAIEILEKHKNLLILGQPGIGKTTLGRMLVNTYAIRHEFEWVCISKSIDEGYKLYEKSKKQIFWFDDFLGRNFLEDSLERNEDKRLVDFLNKIRKDTNKRFVMTTREYIFEQAKNKYEEIKREEDNMDLAKISINLSNYTTKIKADILYNHLYFSDISSDYVKNIISTKSYLKIIKHNNYNPRIIEVLILKNKWKKINPDEFGEYFIKMLDNPEEIWKTAFEKQINPLSRIILFSLLTTQVINYEILLEIVQNFCKINGDKYKTNFDENSFKSSLKELENSFISINTNQNGTYIDFINPSVADFLLYNLRILNNTIEDLLLSSIYSNQLFSIFTNKSSNRDMIILTEKADEIRKKVWIEKFIELKYFERNYKVEQGKPILSTKEENNAQSEKLIKLVQEYPNDKDINLLILNELQEISILDRPFVISNYVTLLEMAEIDAEALPQTFKTLYKNVRGINDLALFRNLKVKYETFFKENILIYDNLQNNVEDIISHEIKYLSDRSVIENSIEDIDNIENIFEIDLYNYKEELITRLDEFDNEDVAEIDYNYYHSIYEEDDNLGGDDLYDDQFNRLLDKNQ